MSNVKIKIGKSAISDTQIENQKDFDKLLTNFETEKIAKMPKRIWGLDALCLIGLAALIFAMKITETEKSNPIISENALPKKSKVLQPIIEKEQKKEKEDKTSLVDHNKIDVVAIPSINKNNNRKDKADENLVHNLNNAGASQLPIASIKNSISDSITPAIVIQQNLDSVLNNKIVDSLITTNLKVQGDSIVKATKEIVWYGLDFSKAIFIGSFGQGPSLPEATGTDMKNRWIPQWNSIMMHEKESFDIGKAYNKEKIHWDFTSVNNVNKQIDTAICVTLNETTVKKTAIDEMIKKYNSEEIKEGIGLVFLVESFNKWTETACIYSVFFDIKTKSVLKANKYEGKAMGWGLRNHWAGTVKSVLIQITNDRITKKLYNK